MVFFFLQLFPFETICFLLKPSQEKGTEQQTSELFAQKVAALISWVLGTHCSLGMLDPDEEARARAYAGNAERRTTTPPQTAN